MTAAVGLAKAQKVALNLIFCTGLIVVGASIVRTYYLYEVGQKSDVSWLIFDVFVWAQLEIQLGIMCASAPALRVFFRSYLSAPLGRAMQGTRSGTRSVLSRQDAYRPGSGISTANIRRTSQPHEQHYRTDFGARHYTEKSRDSVVTATEAGESDHSSTAPSSHYLIRTPADYEAYNLRVMDKHRVSAVGQPGSHGHGAANFSQPFAAAQNRPSSDVWQDSPFAVKRM